MTGGQAMKRTELTILFLIIFMFAGCATMEGVKSTISTKVTAITSNVDPALVAKVPADKRGGFAKTEFAVKAATEKLKLAEMKSELAEKQAKYVNDEEDLANIDLKDVSLEDDILKLEAVDASGLGKKEDNIKTITNLKVKKINLQGDRLKTEANMAAVKRQMTELAEKIKAQEEKVKSLTTGNGKSAEAAPTDKTKESAPAEKSK